MNFTSIEKDLVQSNWIDVSQDPDFISQETGIDKDIVISILQKLSDEGRIEGFDLNESTRIKKIKELFFQNL